ncbi:ATP-binding protein [Ruminococcus sp. YE282]|jgi:two-component system phosphate regulon sensor histidine kinase PhoR|uniref:sensor histidine kinase n=1 Tax=Ruminococcus sp. YE282 TaxID=3158780 RepID=UPI00088B4BF1|nr:two-component system, OmpR family, phosphate regulon sensor histidine kinase PhoR [Ruminococcus bromii]
MTKKIFKSIVLVAGVVLLASIVIIMGVLYQYFGEVQENQMKDELSISSVAVEEDGVTYLSKLESNRYRITWIKADGTVIYDTKNGADTMENHADREEVREALSSGEGEGTRYSSTLLENTMYCAKRLSDGTVLRISMSRASAGALAFGMIQPILIVLIVALALSGILASQISKRIARPLNDLDLEHPLENNTYDEISPLLNRINFQHKEIKSQVKELQQKKDEFNQITSSMNEGLVLLDNNGTILSINPAAQNILETDEYCIGKDFLTIDRRHDMSIAIQNALNNGKSEIRSEINGREYQFDISRIQSANKTIGAVLLAFDITERELAEKTRREFTANVSHELKTPLQGIIGSAELIEGGMVKPEDMPRFVSHIKEEAKRLVVLIEDIIRLSELDEGSAMPQSEVDLLNIANEVKNNLDETAKAKNVSIQVSGKNVVIEGVKRLIYEIIFNLCDNAIKYNKDGGKVDISVSETESNSVIKVKDNGIGIAPEEQNHIFERFYRVDKSHSKASGGTGLGLSIVKHAVQYHNGTVTIDSQIGKGTEITIAIPKNK